MMTRLDWYIARHVMGSVAVVVLVIVGLDLLFAFIDELPDFNEYYGLQEALWYVAQTAPRQAYEQIPLCTLIGCLIGLGSLASSSELVVMRAAGVSTTRIIGAVMKPTMVIMLVAFVLGQFVVPVAEQSANAYRTLTQSGGKDSVVGQGVWNREGQVFSHINAIAADGKVFGVTRYEYDDNWNLARVSRAYSGEYQGDNQWLLTNLSETRFTQDQVLTENKDKDVWQSGLTPARLSVLVIKPDYLSLTGLWGYTQYLKEQGLTAVVYEAAFWQKMLMPVGILGLVLVAVSFIFGPLRSVPMGQRLMTGVCMGLAFKLIQDMMGPASAVFDLPPALAVMFPIAVSFLLGGYLLKRAS